MGRQFPQQSIKGQSRKAIVRYADHHKKESEQRLTILQNALVYNAGLHKTLQHELCACQHGASKHFSEGNACTLVDCECKGFRSNYSVNWGNWKAEVMAYMDRAHGIAPGAVYFDGPLSEVKLTEAFESGVKAEDHAKAAANLMAAHLEQVVKNLNDGVKEIPMEADGERPADTGA